ncbi:MAG: nuclease-related domain-containing protein [Actinoallomurus sp.]
MERDTSTQTSTRDRDDAVEGPGEESPFERPKEETYGDMIGDPQIQRWIRRSAAAVVLGLLFAIVINIPVGLVVAILTVVADVVLKNRKESSVEAWRKPSVAERKTERQLRGMEKAGYRTLHARAVPRDDEGVSDGQIDHLVIGPTGVYAVDSEKWDKRLPVRAMSHRKLFLGPFNKKERLDEARWESEQASRLISGQLGYEVPVQPSLAIYGPAISWKVLMVREVDVYAGGRARNYLRRRPKILNGVDVNRIFDAAENVLPPKYPED